MNKDWYGRVVRGLTQGERIPDEPEPVPPNTAVLEDRVARLQRLLDACEEQIQEQGEHIRTLYDVIEARDRVIANLHERRRVRLRGDADV